MFSATYIDGGAGRILVSSHHPDVATDRAVIVLPAFAEEMNKSRRLVWQIGRRLADQGFLVANPDLYGTGDSEGDFGGATLAIWRDDIRATLDWLHRQSITQVNVLAVRFGANHISAVSEAVAIGRVAIWQPVLTGAEVLSGLVRVKQLNIRMSGEKPRSAEYLREKLFSPGEPIVLSGYSINDNLAKAMQEVEFSIGNTLSDTPFLLIDIGPAYTERNESATSRSNMVRLAVDGERFWRAMEPGANNALIDATENYFVNS